MSAQDEIASHPLAEAAAARPSATARLQRAVGRFGAPWAFLMVGAGLLLIALAWNGAAGHISIVQQLPYLLSGGLIGLALVFLGCSLVVVQSARADRGALEAKLDAVVAELAALREAAAPGPAALRDVADLAVTGLVVAGSSSYHRPTCRLVAGRAGLRYLTAEQAEDADLSACRVCHPTSAAVAV